MTGKVKETWWMCTGRILDLPAATTSMSRTNVFVEPSVSVTVTVYMAAAAILEAVPEISPVLVENASPV